LLAIPIAMLLPHLVASINEAREIIGNASNAENKDVAQLRQVCASLVKVLESPTDRLLNQAFQVRSLPVPTTKPSFHTNRNRSKT
jgi:hypothetical protein